MHVQRTRCRCEILIHVLSLCVLTLWTDSLGLSGSAVCSLFPKILTPQGPDVLKWTRASIVPQSHVLLAWDSLIHSTCQAAPSAFRLRRYSRPKFSLSGAAKCSTESLFFVLPLLLLRLLTVSCRLCRLFGKRSHEVSKGCLPLASWGMSRRDKGQLLS